MSNNLSQIKRDEIIKTLDNIIENTNDESIIIELRKIQAHILEQKYGLIFEKHQEQMSIDLLLNYLVYKNVNSKEIILDDALPMNYIIEGDNLYSLHLLEKTHKKRIDVIYIDPPYNTGSRDWKYNNHFVDANDQFPHSKWLSMMHHRLDKAKTLLKEDGVLITAIDYHELATLKLLIDDLFGDSYTTNIVSIVHNPRGVQGKNFSNTNEFALFTYKKGLEVISNMLISDDDIDWRDLRDNGGESLRTDAKNCFYPVYVKNGEIVGFGEVVSDDYNPQKNEYLEDETIAIYPIDVQGIERKWRYARQSVENVKDFLIVKEKDSGFDIKIGKNYTNYKSVWTDKKFDANEYGTKLINDIVPTNDFDFPKSLYNVYECLYAAAINKKDAIILDFFAGSGTTGHATLMLNKYDQGNRKFILCTNNDIGDKKEKELIKANPEYKDNIYELPGINAIIEEFGIASSITYPRMKNVITGYTTRTKNKTLLKEFKLTKANVFNENPHRKLIEAIEASINDFENSNEYSSIESELDGDTIKLYGVNNRNSEIAGISANLSYYKIDKIRRTEILDSIDFITKINENITPLIEIENHKKIDESKIFILDDQEYYNLIEKIDEFSDRTIYYTPQVLITSQEEKLLHSKNIKLIKIPNLYYDEEFKELGEL